MDTKSKVLLWSLGVLLVLSISGAYYKFMVLNDYLVEMQIDCDPSAESCFVWVCDETVPDECTGDPEEDTWYYKYFYRNASNLPLCDPAEESCDAFVCFVGEASCGEVTCTDDSLSLYGLEQECTDPDSFQDPFIEEAEETIIEEEEALIEEGEEEV